MIRSHKISPIFRVTNKIKKKIKHEDFQASRKIDETSYKFKL